MTESPTLDAPSTPEAVIIENTDVATYDERGKSYELEVERTSHSSHGLDKISHSPQEFRYHLRTSSSGVTIISLSAKLLHFLRPSPFRGDLCVSKLR